MLPVFGVPFSSETVHDAGSLDAGLAVAPRGRAKALLEPCSTVLFGLHGRVAEMVRYVSKTLAAT